MDWNNIYTNISLLPTKILVWFDRVRQDRNVIIFLVFLVISTGFWFLNALRKDYSATLKYPVRIVNVPENKMLSEDFKQRIEVKVRAGGFVILRYQLSNTFLPLILDVEEMIPSPDGEEGDVYTVISEDRPRIMGQLSQGMELIEINPDTLFLPLIEKAKGVVPVKVNASLGFEKQYLQAGSVILEPDSIEVSGPKKIIDTLKFIETQPLVLDNLSDTVTTVLPLIVPSGINASHKRVTAMVPVEPFTEMNIEIPLMFSGLPDSLRIKTFPSEIQVSFRVGISKYETISESQFRAVIDVAQVMGEHRPERLKVRLDRVPREIESVSFSPIFVEYLLEKRR